MNRVLVTSTLRRHFGLSSSPKASNVMSASSWSEKLNDSMHSYGMSKLLYIYSLYSKPIQLA